MKLLLAFLLLAFALLPLGGASALSAQSEAAADPKLLLEQVIVDGYDIAVAGEASNTCLGCVKFSVTLRNAATGQPITDAQVRIHTRHLLEDETAWALALSAPARPEDYRVPGTGLKLEYPGPWQVSVAVDGPLGQTETAVGAITVPEPRQYVVGTLVFAGVSVVLLFIVGYLVWSIRQSQRRREAANAG